MAKKLKAFLSLDDSDGIVVVDDNDDDGQEISFDEMARMTLEDRMRPGIAVIWASKLRTLADRLEEGLQEVTA